MSETYRKKVTLGAQQQKHEEQKHKFVVGTCKEMCPSNEIEL